MFWGAPLIVRSVFLERALDMPPVFVGRSNDGRNFVGRATKYARRYVIAGSNHAGRFLWGAPTIARNFVGRATNYAWRFVGAGSNYAGRFLWGAPTIARKFVGRATNYAWRFVGAGTNYAGRFFSGAIQPPGKFFVGRGTEHAKAKILGR